MIGARNIKKTERKESIEFRNRNKEKYVWDNNKYKDNNMFIENDRHQAETPVEFSGIDIDNKDNRPSIELLSDTDK